MNDRSSHSDKQLDFQLLAIFAVVLLFHLLSINLKFLMEKENQQLTQNKPNSPLKIRSIRTLGLKEAHQKSILLTSSDSKDSKDIKKTPFKNHAIPQKKSINTQRASAQPKTLEELTKSKLVEHKKGRFKVERPRAIKNLSLRGKNIPQFLQQDQLIPSYAQNIEPSLNNSNVQVHLEVPEGVSEDKLNKFEMMFYSFQKRTAMSYVLSFFKTLQDFERSNPHLQFPMTEDFITLTARVTFDKFGNIVQIKMIRWTDLDRLQDFFVDVLDGINSLPNPPQAILNQKEEFNIYYKLILNG